MVRQVHFTVKNFFAKYGVAAAFLFLAFIGGYAIDRSSHDDAVKLRDSQVQACERGNGLRRENNSRMVAHIKDRDTLAEFLRAAAAARQAAGTPLDIETAHRYRSLADSLEKNVTFDKLPLVDCQAAIPRP
jgi:hypothetical protein